MKTLPEYRSEIDIIDENILALLAKRFSIVEKIGRIKTEQGIDVVDKEREDEILNRLATKAKELLIPETMIGKIWNIIFEHSYKKEQ